MALRHLSLGMPSTGPHRTVSLGDSIIGCNQGFAGSPSGSRNTGRRLDVEAVYTILVPLD